MSVADERTVEDESRKKVDGEFAIFQIITMIIITVNKHAALIGYKKK